MGSDSSYAAVIDYHFSEYFLKISGKLVYTNTEWNYPFYVLFNKSML